MGFVELSLECRTNAKDGSGLDDVKKKGAIERLVHSKKLVKGHTKTYIKKNSRAKQFKLKTGANERIEEPLRIGRWEKDHVVLQSKAQKQLTEKTDKSYGQTNRFEEADVRQKAYTVGIDTAVDDACRHEWSEKDVSCNKRTQRAEPVVHMFKGKLNRKKLEEPQVGSNNEEEHKVEYRSRRKFKKERNTNTIADRPKEMKLKSSTGESIQAEIDVLRAIGEREEQLKRSIQCCRDLEEKLKFILDSHKLQNDENLMVESQDEVEMSKLHMSAKRNIESSVHGMTKLQQLTIDVIDAILNWKSIMQMESQETRLNEPAMYIEFKWHNVNYLEKVVNDIQPILELKWIKAYLQCTGKAVNPFLLPKIRVMDQDQMSNTFMTSIQDQLESSSNDANIYDKSDTQYVQNLCDQWHVQFPAKLPRIRLLELEQGHMKVEDAMKEAKLHAESIQSRKATASGMYDPFAKLKLIDPQTLENLVDEYKDGQFESSIQTEVKLRDFRQDVKRMGPAPYLKKNGQAINRLKVNDSQIQIYQKKMDQMGYHNAFSVVPSSCGVGGGQVINVREMERRQYAAYLKITTQYVRYVFRSRVLHTLHVFVKCIRKASTQIQSIIRGYLGRKFYHTYQRAKALERIYRSASIRKLQTVVRRYLSLTKKNTTRSESASSLMALVASDVNRAEEYRRIGQERRAQRELRQIKLRKAAKLAFQEKVQAVGVIQRNYRNHLSYVVLAIMQRNREERLLASSVLVAQRIARGHIARQQVKDLRNTISVQQHTAAVRIQSVARGNCVRKQLVSIVKTPRERSRSIVITSKPSPEKLPQLTKSSCAKLEPRNSKKNVQEKETLPRINSLKRRKSGSRTQLRLSEPNIGSDF